MTSRYHQQIWSDEKSAILIFAYVSTTVSFGWALTQKLKDEIDIFQRSLLIVRLTNVLVQKQQLSKRECIIYNHDHTNLQRKMQMFINVAKIYFLSVYKCSRIILFGIFNSKIMDGRDFYFILFYSTKSAWFTMHAKIKGCINFSPFPLASSDNHFYLNIG